MIEQRRRRPDPVLWSVTAVVIVWAAVIIAASATRYESVALLSLPVLAIVVIGAALYFILAGRAADRALRRNTETAARMSDQQIERARARLRQSSLTG